MAYFVLYNTTTGRAVSMGASEPETIANGFAVAEFADAPERDQMWDETTLTFIARPQTVLIDRLQDLLENPNYADAVEVYNNLNAARKQLFRNFLIRLLDKRRFRHSSETVELD